MLWLPDKEFMHFCREASVELGFNMEFFCVCSSPSQFPRQQFVNFQRNRVCREVSLVAELAVSLRSFIALSGIPDASRHALTYLVAAA